MSNKPLPRMRTAKNVLALIKEQDPGTDVSLHYLRQLINSGKIPVVQVGNKKLINADLVIEYIGRGEECASVGSRSAEKSYRETERVGTARGIRRVEP